MSTENLIIIAVVLTIFLGIMVTQRKIKEHRRAQVFRRKMPPQRSASFDNIQNPDWKPPPVDYRKPRYPQPRRSTSTASAQAPVMLSKTVIVPNAPTIPSPPSSPAKPSVASSKTPTRTSAPTPQPLSVQPPQSLLAPTYEHPRVFGYPASKLVTGRNTFAHDNLAKGVQGELRTAQMLTPLLDNEDLYIIHGLQFPGSKTADVDHAVVLGNKVALIDSKMWAGAEYYWEDEQTVIQRFGQNTKRRNVYFHTAVERYAYLLHKSSAQVQGWVLIQTDSTSGVRTRENNMGLPAITPAVQGIAEIRQWLETDNSGYSPALHKFMLGMR